jgi:hypothetical protein
LADWVLAMDNGRNNILGLVDDGPTGLASNTGGLAYHGPGRGCGNSVNALLDAWQLSRQRHYLDYAESLIRRSIHPKDDLTARDLLNIETRWSYTMFLSSLAKYLELKGEAGELDEMYAYSRESLLHYARWMVDNERPHFDQVEKMEYPTEVWAAHDLRKANVLRRSMSHASEPLREQLLAKGNRLAQRAWQDLYRFESRANARATAILMIEGLLDCVFHCRTLDRLPSPTRDYYFGEPQKFIPQRIRVKKNLKNPLGLLRICARLASPWRWFKVKWSR